MRSPDRDLIEIHVEIERAKTLLDLTDRRTALFDVPKAANLWFCVLYGMKRHLATIEAMVKRLTLYATCWASPWGLRLSHWVVLMR